MIFVNTKKKLWQASFSSSLLISYFHAAFFCFINIKSFEAVECYAHTASCVHALLERLIAFHLGHIDHGAMAIDAELGLDAEGDKAFIELCLDLRRPRVVQMTCPEFRHLREIQVEVGEDCEQLVGIFQFATEGLPDNFEGNALHG